MNKTFLWSIIILILVSSMKLMGQEIFTAKELYSRFDSLSTLDNDLYNGYRYNENLLAARGNPFLTTESRCYDKIKYNGRVFKNVCLRYNVHEGLVVLEYCNKQGAYNQISLINDNVEWFEISRNVIDKNSYKGGSRNAISNVVKQKNGLSKTMLFVRNEHEHIDLPYYNQINEGAVVGLLFFTKKYELFTEGNYSEYGYTDLIRILYVKHNDNIVLIRNNKKLYGLFEKEKGKLVKKFLKENKINIKSSAYSDLLGLFQFINNI